MTAAGVAAATATGGMTSAASTTAASTRSAVAGSALARRAIARRALPRRTIVWSALPRRIETRRILALAHYRGRDPQTLLPAGSIGRAEALTAIVLLALAHILARYRGSRASGVPWCTEPIPAAL